MLSLKQYIKQPSTNIPGFIQSAACPTGMFRCDDRSMCIPGEKQCDYTEDCPDTSDESDYCQGGNQDCRTFLKHIVSCHRIVCRWVLSKQI